MPQQLYYTIQPEPLEEIVTAWLGNLGSYTHVIGYSALGHLFLVDYRTGEHAVLHPLQRGWKSYGVFASHEEFHQKVLEDPGFAIFVLQSGLVQEVAERIGELEDGQCYYPVPYPFLGGSGAPETYDKGSLVVFLEIVGQALLPGA